MNQLLLEKLNWLASAWLTWMTSMSIHVALLVILLVVLERCLRGVSARLRFVLWLLVLARLVVPPDVASPTGLMWWIDPSWSSLLSWSPQSTPVDLAGQQPALATTSISEPLASVPSPRQDGTSTTDSSSVPWSTTLCMVWLAAVAGQLGLMIYGWLLVERWLSMASDVTDAATLRVLASARQRVGMQRDVRLRDCGQCTTPLVIGWYRPVILVPTPLLQTLSPAELEAVLVHELTHLIRGDCGWRVIQSVLRTFYFFHPAVWLANRALCRTCEEACDELTVQALSGQRRDYAEAIFKSAAMIGYQAPHLALNMLGDALPVQHRLARILDPQLPQSPGGERQRIAIVVLLACVLLPTGQRPMQAGPPSTSTAEELAESPSRLNSSELSTAESSLDNQPDIQPDIPAPTDMAGVREAEQLALAQLKSELFEVRMQAYETLSRIGTLTALPDLEAAFLARSGIEQDAAQRALKHVWNLVREMPSENNHSTRLFQTPLEN